MVSQPFAPDQSTAPIAADSTISSPALRLERLSKHFAGHHVVREVSLDIARGEIVTILGPSGCGKTTLLRLVAGLLDPDEGRISLGTRALADAAARISVPVEKRGIGLVFQDYALWPHLTVRQHLLFPLELRRVRGAAAAARVDELLQLVRLDGLSERLPGQLSGGQQQRVALARSLAAQAELLLLDEPLSNLDARLRQTMRDEIQTLLRATGVTAIAVTHDQADALAISDRVVVMSAGRVIQEGSPQEVFERPVSSTVAHFLGSGSLVPGRIVGEANADGLVSFCANGSDQAFPALASLPNGTAGASLVAVIPMSTAAPDTRGVPLTTLSGEVRSCQYAGGVWDLHVVLPGGHDISLRSPMPATPGAAWNWQLPSQAIRLIPNDEPSSGGNAAANVLT